MRPFKVGDRVVSFEFRIGEVIEGIEGSHRFPVVVKFTTCGPQYYSFTSKGQYFEKCPCDRDIVHLTGQNIINLLLNGEQL